MCLALNALHLVISQPHSPAENFHRTASGAVLTFLESALREPMG